MAELILKLENFIWGWPLIILIFSVGIILTVKTRLIQVRRLLLSIKYMVTNEKGAEGDVSSFGAFCTALSATIGTGNIVGVASAISIGGPGALFWLIISAVVGMPTKYAEGLLAVKYRAKTDDGKFIGGPFYYIEKGMGKRHKPLAMLFSFFGVLASIMGIGTITQINSITSAVEGFYDPKKQKIFFSIGESSYTYATVITGVIVTIFAALVILGGIKRISNVSQIIVPFMAALYIGFALTIIIRNREGIPNAITLIVKSAFSVDAVGGAIAGLSLKQVLRMGIGRGIFSNEAGLGSAPIAAAASKTREPVRQGLVSMTATLIDTVIICSMTGLTIVLTSAWNSSVTGIALEGIEITTFAWKIGLPFPYKTSTFLLLICLSFFAFTTIIGWDYYGEKCLQYLSNGKESLIKVYKFLYIAAVFIGPYLSVSSVWALAGIFNGLMAIPNLIALVKLRSVVKNETDEYFNKKHSK